MCCMGVAEVVEAVGRQVGSTDQPDPVMVIQVGCIIRPSAWAQTKCSSDSLTPSFRSSWAWETR